MSGNVTTLLIAVVLAILFSRGGVAQYFTPEFVSPLAMEAPYDGFVIDNSELTLKTFERLHVRFGGKPACVVLVHERGPEAEPARKLAGRLGLTMRQELELSAPFPAYE